VLYVWCMFLISDFEAAITGFEIAVNASNCLYSLVGVYKKDFSTKKLKL
jgi:hypothetical protein